MSVTIRIPTVLRKYAEQKSLVEVDGERVEDALETLAEQYPELRPHLFDPDGRLRAFVNVYLNAEDVRHLDPERRRLSNGDPTSRSHR